MMTHHDLIIFCLGLAAMLLVALVFGHFMRKLRQPALLGELIGGILLGPTVFGALAPSAHHWLFPATGPAFISREAVVKLGMLFFLFVAGLEINLSHLKKQGLSVVLTSLSGVALPFALGFGAVLIFPALWYSEGRADGIVLALFLGTAMSISALPVIARILIDLNLLKSRLGTVVISAATIDDLIGWSLFAVILSHFIPNTLREGRSILLTLVSVFGLFAVMLTLGRWFGQRVIRWLQSFLPAPSGFMGLTAILVLAAAAFAEVLGVHAVFGAFLVGVALAPNAEKRDETHETIYQFVTSFFAAPIYFVSIGLRANFAANFDLLLVAVVFLIACAGKVIGVGLGAWLSGMPPKEALAIGFGMNARGAMEMILASVALEYGLIDERIFIALIVMALVTSLLGAPVMKRILKIH